MDSWGPSGLAPLYLSALTKPDSSTFLTPNPCAAAYILLGSRGLPHGCTLAQNALSHPSLLPPLPLKPGYPFPGTPSRTLSGLAILPPLHPLACRTILDFGCLSLHLRLGWWWCHCVLQLACWLTEQMFATKSWERSEIYFLVFCLFVCFASCHN